MTSLIHLRLLDKEGHSIVSQLHVQIHRLSVDFNVNLARDRSSLNPPHPLEHFQMEGMG